MGKKILLILVFSFFVTNYSFADFSSVSACTYLFQARTGPQNRTIESNNLLQGRLLEIEQLKDKELQSVIYSILSE